MNLISRLCFISQTLKVDLRQGFRHTILPHSDKTLGMRIQIYTYSNIYFAISYRLYTALTVSIHKYRVEKISI